MPKLYKMDAVLAVLEGSYITSKGACVVYISKNPMDRPYWRAEYLVHTEAERAEDNKETSR